MINSGKYKIPPIQMDCGHNKHIHISHNDELQDTSVQLPVDTVNHIQAVPNTPSTNPVALVNSGDLDHHTDRDQVLHPEFLATNTGTGNGVSAYVKRFGIHFPNQRVYGLVDQLHC